MSFLIEYGLLGKFTPIGVLGSTSFFDKSGYSKNLSIALGKAINNNTSYVLVSGGLSGVAETTVMSMDDTTRIFNVLPLYEYSIIKKGTLIRKGCSMEERRTHLAQMCDIYFMIEGGPGTVDEAQKVLQLNEKAILLPIMKSGGAASGMFFDNSNEFFTLVNERIKLRYPEKGEKLISLYQSDSSSPEFVIQEIFKCFEN